VRDAPEAFVAALTVGDVVPRYLVWVAAKTHAGDPAPLGFWSGDGTVDFTVTDADGVDVTRTYRGGRSVLDVDPIRRSSDLTITQTRFRLSQLDTAAQQLVRGYDVRLAHVEIHDALFRPGGVSLLAPPQLVYVGLVDGAPITTPAAGSDGQIEVTCIPEVLAMLDRKQPRRSSGAGQKQRDANDGFGKYSGSVATWKLKWGQS
jgi:hypothetical protein